MNIEPNLNIQNAELLAELRNDFQVNFEIKEINYCEVFTKSGVSTIYYNPKIVDDESIAHELLHIWLNKYDYYIGNHIYLSCQSHSKLKKVFVKFLCDYIENCFDHFKMYPKYTEMGYGAEKFIINGLEEKCSIRDIKTLNIRFLRLYKAKSINKFIGYLISIYADHVENDYSEHLRLLNLKEPKLFKIVTEFWNNWVEFDIRKIDPIYNSDIELAEKFINEMEKWIEQKNII